MMLATAIAMMLAAPEAATAPATPRSAADAIRDEARALAPLARSELVRQFLGATSALAAVSPRRLWHDEGKTRYYTEAEDAKLPEDRRGALIEESFDEEYYYTTRYGTPLAYARPLDILAESGLTGVAG
ncbi:MAG TPA: hypothetical protein VGK94_00680 [Candidatus Polarisedimenticolia bacterium]|jgi:hypothetical protein